MAVVTQLLVYWGLGVVAEFVVLAAGREAWKSKFHGAFVLNVADLHAIDATPDRWRGDAGSSPLDGASAAASSPRNDREELSGASDTVDFHTGEKSVDWTTSGITRTGKPTPSRRAARPAHWTDNEGEARHEGAAQGHRHNRHSPAAAMARVNPPHLGGPSLRQLRRLFIPCFPT